MTDLPLQAIRTALKDAQRAVSDLQHAIAASYEDGDAAGAPGTLTIAGRHRLNLFAANASDELNSIAKRLVLIDHHPETRREMLHGGSDG